MILISCDPGLGGAIVLWVDGQPKQIADMPNIKKGSKNIVDYNEIARLFNSFNPEIVVIEQVGASPRMGTSSAFNFGMSFGILLGAAAGCGARVETITSQKWKAATGLLKKEKDAARGRVIELYPEHKDWFKLKKHVDRADATLIGHAYLMFNGG